MSSAAATWPDAPTSTPIRRGPPSSTPCSTSPREAADEAIALAALACQKGLTWDEALLAALARRRGHRWGTLLTEALVDIGAGAQSTFEVRYVRDVERAHGLPPGRPQQPTGGSRRHHD